MTRRDAREREKDSRVLARGASGSPLSPPRTRIARTPGPFRSIVWPDSGDGGWSLESSSVRDLALDRVFAFLEAGRTADARPICRRPARTVATIAYRQAVVADLDGASGIVVEQFRRDMRAVRDTLDRASGSAFRYESQGRYLAAARGYATAVDSLRSGLAASRPHSDGLRTWKTWLDGYVKSETFIEIRDGAARVAAGLEGVRCSIVVEGAKVRIGPPVEAEDLGGAIERTFRRFGESGNSESARVSGGYFDPGETDRVEEAIVSRVARLDPKPFAALDAFASRARDLVDPMIARFYLEVRFYLDYLAFIRPMRDAGLPFCFPTLSAGHGIDLASSFDLALADACLADDRPVVLNDAVATARERILVVTGPNQGGKTTFARMIGQAYVLASLGLPVPGESARVHLVDGVLTHFEREERIADLRGKLEDDLVRLKGLLDRATPDTVLVLNETLSATTLDDARVLGERVLRRILRIRARCVYVTFVDELSALGPETVSLMCIVDESDPSVRTYRIVRKPADGLAHAVALASRHGLTRESLRARLGKRSRA